MAIVLRIGWVLAFLIAASGSAGALNDPSRSDGLHSRVRLLSGGVMDGRRLAGIEIALDPGFKTYWRNPGESGLPPRLDWSASDNVADVTVLWPAPTRIEDAGGVAYVYSHEIVLPVLVTPRVPSRPVRLALSVDYGICRDICIPVHADIARDLAGDDALLVLHQALARVPKPEAIGSAASLAILSVTREPGAKATYTVATRAPAGHPPSLFAEGPDNWYVATSAPDDRNRFTLTIDETLPAQARAPVLLTLAAGDQAVATEVVLDGSGSSP
ncbi:MAG: protein-disulfide reductase DsbD domain-containing protein [Microvirga sp.]